MKLFESIQNLVVEHGSSVVMRERLQLIRDKCEALESKLVALVVERDGLQSNIAKLDLQVERLGAQIVDLSAENAELKDQIKGMQERNFHSSNPLGNVCDHCGSAGLQRSGSRSDPVFGDLGKKQALFVCVACGKESAF